MTQQEALDFTVQIISAQKTDLENKFDDSNQDMYYRGFNRGYIAGLENALRVINGNRVFFPVEPNRAEPTCAACGSLLTSADIDAGETTCLDCAGQSDQ